MTEANSAVLDADSANAAETSEKFWPHGWWKMMNFKIGVIPVPLFLLTGGLIYALVATKGGIKADITSMVAMFAFFGFACGEIGKRIPFLGKMGAAAICATFIPSAMVYYGVLPPVLIKVTTEFYKSTNILYLYICCIIVGSILSMDRKTLIQGFMKIMVPMACSAVAAMTVGTLVGVLMGKTAFDSFFFIVLPCMAGGVGEGAIPLSIGFSEILKQDQGLMFGRIIPMVMMANVIAIFTAGALNQLGKKHQHLTGNGRLFPGETDETGALNLNSAIGKIDIVGLGGAVLMAILMYLAGVIGQRVIGLPAPVGMLFVAVIVKLLQLSSPELNDGAQTVYKFFSTSVTYPILFAVGVAITPFNELINAFQISNVIVIFATVMTAVSVGFFVAKRIGMNPVDVAVVSCTQCGQGGTGDVAILSSANRMQLMPFAQIATRIGGAINVTLALIVLARFFHG
ncbi:MAG: 2-hydroxycarboxylate transporter family protein [Formivibrio sp.]|nr:2-hydroxycarboxylate transporter family protein [Formivibrio sp.]